MIGWSFFRTTHYGSGDFINCVFDPGFLSNFGSSVYTGAYIRGDDNVTSVTYDENFPGFNDLPAKPLSIVEAGTLNLHPYSTLLLPPTGAHWVHGTTIGTSSGRCKMNAGKMVVTNPFQPPNTPLKFIINCQFHALHGIYRPFATSAPLLFRSNTEGDSSMAFLAEEHYDATIQVPGFRFLEFFSNSTHPYENGVVSANSTTPTLKLEGLAHSVKINWDASATPPVPNRDYLLYYTESVQNLQSSSYVDQNSTYRFEISHKKISDSPPLSRVTFRLAGYVCNNNNCNPLSGPSSSPSSSSPAQLLLPSGSFAMAIFVLLLMFLSY